MDSCPDSCPQEVSDVGCNSTLADCGKTLRAQFSPTQQRLELTLELSQSLVAVIEGDNSLARHFGVPLASDSMAGKIDQLFGQLQLIKDDEGEIDNGICWLDIILAPSYKPMRRKDGYYYSRLDGRSGLIRVSEADHNFIESGLPQKLINPCSYPSYLQSEAETTRLVERLLLSSNELASQTLHINLDVVIDMNNECHAKMGQRLRALTQLPGNYSANTRQIHDKSNHVDLQFTEPPEPATPKGVRKRKPPSIMPPWEPEELDRLPRWFQDNRHLTKEQVEAKFEKDFGISRTFGAITTAQYRARNGHGARHVGLKRKLHSDDSLSPSTAIESAHVTIPDRIEPFLSASDSGPRPSVSFLAPVRSLGNLGTSNSGTTEEQSTESSHETTHFETVTTGDTAEGPLREVFSSLNTSRAEVEYFGPTASAVLNPKQTTKNGRRSGRDQSTQPCPDHTQEGSKPDVDFQGTYETDSVTSTQPADPHYQLNSGGLNAGAGSSDAASSIQNGFEVTGARPHCRRILPKCHDHPGQMASLPVHHEQEPSPASISSAQATTPVSRSWNVSVSLQPFLLPDDEQTLQDFYMGMGAENACGDRLWRIVKQLANSQSHRSGHQQLGLRRAAELFQLAIGIASPQALIMLKECLRELRSQSPPPESYAETAGGVFRALQAFSKEGHVSKVGLRLAQWRLYRMKKYSESISEDIVRSIPPGKAVPTSAEIQGVLAAHKKGVYWDNLVEAAGHQSPNILCLIPPLVIGPPPWRRKFGATAYRDMPIAEKAILGELLWSLKRQMFLCMDRNLPSVLLRMRPPGGLYPLEETSNESLLQNGSLLSFDPNMLRETGSA